MEPRFRVTASPYQDNELSPIHYNIIIFANCVLKLDIMHFSREWDPIGCSYSPKELFAS
jgi:hypothetical protein